MFERGRRRCAPQQTTERETHRHKQIREHAAQHTKKKKRGEERERAVFHDAQHRSPREIQTTTRVSSKIRTSDRHTHTGTRRHTDRAREKRRQSRPPASQHCDLSTPRSARERHRGGERGALNHKTRGSAQDERQGERDEGGTEDSLGATAEAVGGVRRPHSGEENSKEAEDVRR